MASVARQFGGPSKACLEMANALAERGHDVSLFATNMDGLSDMTISDLAHDIQPEVDIRLFQVNWPRFWKPSIEMAAELKREIKNFDVVHVHSLYLFHNLVGGYYCRKHDIPYIVRPHGTLDPFLYRRHRFRKAIMEILFENRNLQNAAAIHFTTEEEMELARPYTFGSPGIVIPNGLHPAEYSELPQKGSFRSKHPETAGKKLILFFSRINFKKGLDILTPAFIKLAKKHSDYHLALVGPDDSNLVPGIIKQLQQAGLETEGPQSRITITGMISGDDKLAALNDADVFVLPSYSENFGIAVIEAMICGLPVIISDRVNIWREVMEDRAGIAGPCDINWFADTIENLLEQPEKRHEMGLAGIASVKKRYDWKNIAIQLENAYLDIIEKHKKKLSTADI